MLNTNTKSTTLDNLLEKFFDPETPWLEHLMIMGTAAGNLFISFVNGKRSSFTSWRHFTLRFLSGVVKFSSLADKHYRGLTVTVGTSASTVALLDHSLVTGLIMEGGQPALFAATLVGRPAEKKRKALVAKWCVPLAGDFGYGLGQILRKLSAL